MRFAVATALAAALAGPGARADEATPHDAKSWAALVAEAQKHGGTLTKLDKSSSYVFQQESGEFVTLTEWRAPLKRYLCAIAQNQKATVCVHWETGRTTYGERADDASPWKTRAAKPLEETEQTTKAGDFIRHVIDRLTEPPVDEYIVIRKHH